jgi:hypothetical protein
MMAVLRKVMERTSVEIGEYFDWTRNRMTTRPFKLTMGWFTWLHSILLKMSCFPL